jgi:hypothetical protein
VFEVLVDDNFHYMYEAYRYKLGPFDDCESALAECKRIVDEFLNGSYEPGMTSAQLWQQFVTFGEDPSVVTDDPDCPHFSAWAYSKVRCEEICQNSS